MNLVLTLDRKDVLERKSLDRGQNRLEEASFQAWLTLEVVLEGSHQRRWTGSHIHQR